MLSINFYKLRIIYISFLLRLNICIATTLCNMVAERALELIEFLSSDDIKRGGLLTPDSHRWCEFQSRMDALNKSVSFEQ